MACNVCYSEWKVSFRVITAVWVLKVILDTNSVGECQALSSPSNYLIITEIEQLGH
jgi:hypothetical protein